MSNFLLWPWSMIGAGIALLVLLMAAWVNFGRPALRKYRLKHPCDVFFHIGAARQPEFNYVIQDDDGHNVRELVLPANSSHYLELQYLPKLDFKEESLILSFDGDRGSKPQIKERINSFVAVGKNRWIPGEDESDSLTREGAYQIKRPASRNTGTWFILGLRVETKRAGVYKLSVYFLSTEVEGSAELLLRVEDRPSTIMKCASKDHWQCRIKPAFLTT